MKLKLLPLLVLIPFIAVRDQAGSAEPPRIIEATPMDRWVDLKWSYAGTAPAGFAVALSADGHDFKAAEQVGSEARSASVFVSEKPRSFMGWGGKVYLRVAALDASGQSGSWSEVVSVIPAKPRDIESEVRGRFDYWNDRRPYNVNDPAYTVVYSDEQKLRQRTAARDMFARLLQVATNTTVAREFVIPPGVYRVEPDQMRIRGAANFTIRASGVEMIVDGEKSGSAFGFEACTNLTLTGRAAGVADVAPKSDAAALIVDSEQLPMSVSRILACDLKGFTLDVEIQPGYGTDLPEDERMIAYNLQGQMLNVQQMGWKGVTSLGGRKFRLSSNSLRYPINQKMVLVPGNLLVLHSNPHHSLRTHAACSARLCQDMTYESIRVYNGGGAPADHGTAGNTIYRDWRLYPRPGTSRLPIATGLGQFSKNGGTFIFENCEFGPHLDDGINLLSGMSIVGRQESPNTVIITGGQLPTVGSSLSFYDYTNWVHFGTAKVVSSERITDVDTLAEVNAFAKLNRTVQNARNVYRTVLDRPVTPTKFAMVVHSDYRADTIIVRGCLFRDQLAQIMLLQGVKRGLIENNLLLRSAGGGVSAQFSQYWWEGPMPANLFIRNNVFRDNPVEAAVNGFDGNASIAIYAGTKYPTSERLLSGFRIEGNLILNPSVYGIAVRNTDQVVIRHNKIVNPGAKAVEGTFHGKPIADQYAAICLDAVSHATVSDNEFVFGNPRCQRPVLMETNCDTATVWNENNH